MDYYFWLKWADSNNCEHVVGILYYTNKKYHFRYNKEFLNPDNIPLGFNGVPSFGKLKEISNEKLQEVVLAVYSSTNLFNFFAMRIPKRFDMYIWKSYGLTDYDECKLLKLTQAILPTDSFFVEEMDSYAIEELLPNYLQEN